MEQLPLQYSTSRASIQFYAELKSSKMKSDGRMKETWFRGSGMHLQLSKCQLSMSAGRRAKQVLLDAPKYPEHWLREILTIYKNGFLLWEEAGEKKLDLNELKEELLASNRLNVVSMCRWSQPLVVVGKQEAGRQGNNRMALVRQLHCTSVSQQKWGS